MKRRRVLIWAVVLVVFAISLSGCEKDEQVSADENATIVIPRSAPTRGGAGGSGGTIREQLFAAAAERLDVTVEALTEALGSPPDLEAAAKKLGIAIEKIRDAIPQPAQGGFGGKGRAFARAAETLDIAVEDLAEALGSPPDLEAAAKKLKISLEKLEEALPFTGSGYGQRNSGDD
jgi:hypothetical protein